MRVMDMCTCYALIESWTLRVTSIWWFLNKAHILPAVSMQSLLKIWTDYIIPISLNTIFRCKMSLNEDEWNCSDNSTQKCRATQRHMMSIFRNISYLVLRIAWWCMCKYVCISFFDVCKKACKWSQRPCMSTLATPEVRNCEIIRLVRAT